MSQAIPAPPLAYFAVEGRALGEMGLCLQAMPLLLQAPKGDGHGVLVLPGFTAGDGSTFLLRRYLKRLGYDAVGWRLGRNTGPSDRLEAAMIRRLRGLFWRTGGKVSVVGWSLGGIYARELARQQPEMVRQVITLGSPYRITHGDRSSASHLWERLEHWHSDELPMIGHQEEALSPLTVPATSIYTRDDGVVRWQLCIDATGPDAPNPRAENIEVHGTHTGLGLNPSVIVAMLDRLAQAEDEWRPFHPPLAIRLWYPPPAAWTPRDAVDAVA